MLSIFHHLRIRFFFTLSMGVIVVIPNKSIPFQSLQIIEANLLQRQLVHDQLYACSLREQS